MTRLLRDNAKLHAYNREQPAFQMLVVVSSSSLMHNASCIDRHVVTYIALALKVIAAARLKPGDNVLGAQWLFVIQFSPVILTTLASERNFRRRVWHWRVPCPPSLIRYSGPPSSLFLVQSLLALRTDGTGHVILPAALHSLSPRG